MEQRVWKSLSHVTNNYFVVCQYKLLSFLTSCMYALNLREPWLCIDILHCTCNFDACKKRNSKQGKKIRWVLHIKAFINVLIACCPDVLYKSFPWWRHQMETFSALRVLCAGKSPVTGEIPSRRPMTWSLMFLRLNKRLSKQSKRRWFETPLRSLWRQGNVIVI